ncbi:hypothetical protein PT282_06810 [Bifidobacterium sp. ESL0763]|uniref:hypothetical protein n=1 Tax=Bifidobacterium sp. ESL0763 TaxID=2983227 RepID=UPI0023FA2019|nr:hypothetical protein [Bifidobacterium sp. ESL0763]MDF7664367.1 hypothetical protein [Bifidobacterium sp. ESL0763]
MSQQKKDSDSPEIIQFVVTLAVALSAKADSLIADILLTTLTGCALATYWRHRRN